MDPVAHHDAAVPAPAGPAEFEPVARPPVARDRRPILPSARSAATLVVICAAICLGGYASCSAWGALGPHREALPSATRPVVQLRYVCYHPFNLVYRIMVQTLFGRPGETVGRLPMLYSTFELEVVLRSVNGSSSAAPPSDWTDLPSYAAGEPVAAYMYAASMLTLPRATMLYAWLNDHGGAYKLLRTASIDFAGALDTLTMGLLGKGQCSDPSAPTQPAPAPTAAAPAAAQKGETLDCGDGCVGHESPPATEPAPAPAPAPAAPSRPAPSGLLGLWLLPLGLLCPGLLTCYLALALVDAAPVAVGWVVATGLFRAFCELRVLLHVAGLLRRRRAQAAVQCLACSHGVPVMLGCHALLLLRLAGAVLPPNLFLVLSYHMYGTWAPLAAAAVMLLALQPNNGQILEGAVDGILHLGHRAADELQAATANGLGAAASLSVRRKQHWPPPVAVPPHLQEAAELAPKHLLCPITHHILTEPAVTVTGATYERSAIVEWLSTAGKDPLTGHTVSPDEVFPNLAMYSAVEEYVRAGGSSR